MGALEKCKTMVIFVLHLYGYFCHSGRIYVRVYQQFGIFNVGKGGGVDICLVEYSCIMTYQWYLMAASL